VATLKDLSKHLGLSLTQTSRAINNHDDVSAETKRRVHEAARELGYSVNLSARSLVTGKSSLIGLIRPGHLSVPKDTAVFETITGLSMEFSNRDLQFVLQMTNEDANAADAYKMAISSGAFGGFVLIEAKEDDSRIAVLKAANVPYVVHGRVGPDPRHPYFDIDNAGVSYAHVAHLTALGHKKIALLCGQPEFSFAARRVEGYKQALADAGLAFDPSLITYGPMTEDQGLIATIKQFSEPNDRPTALVCSNILLAKGAYAALHALGLSIPHEVSVVAHDDVLSDVRASAFHPALTVTKSPFSQSWVNLADILEGILRNKSVPKQVIAAHEFHDRSSTSTPIN